MRHDGTLTMSRRAFVGATASGLGAASLAAAPIRSGKVWPDAPPALAQLRTAGICTCLLSNLSEDLLAANLNRSGLAAAFDHVLSTDRVRQYKPAPEAYAMAQQDSGLPKGAIGFAAFGGWDTVGATWLGYRTAWVNRSGASSEWLDVQPEVTARGIEAVLALAGLS